MSRDRDDDVAALVRDLSETLQRLEGEIGPERPRRGPFGLPPPPSPRDIMAFTGEYAIPTAIAVLKANIRILELVGAVLRATTPGDKRGEGSRTRLENLSTTTVDGLGRALAEIQHAIEEGSLPQTPEARDVVTEARRLNDELREYVDESEKTVEEERQHERERDRQGRSIPIEDGEEDREDGEDEIDEDASVQINIDEELRSIKDSMADGGDGDDEQEGGDDGDGDDETGDDGAGSDGTGNAGDGNDTGGASNAGDVDDTGDASGDGSDEGNSGQ